MSPIFQLTNHQELWAFIVTNLASVYIREGNRHQEVVGDMLHVWYPFNSYLEGGVWEVWSWAPANLSTLGYFPSNKVSHRVEHGRGWEEAKSRTETFP